MVRSGTARLTVGLGNFSGLLVDPNDVTKQQKIMAFAEAWTCPVCHDVMRRCICDSMQAYVLPQLHPAVGEAERQLFAVQTTMRPIKVSVYGVEQFIECFVSLPAVPVPIFH